MKKRRLRSGYRAESVVRPGEGNLREKSLREIWEDPDAFSYNRKFSPEMLTGKCASCVYGCVCAGDCRSYIYFANGGKLYENPLCARKT
ncbi:MAG: SPASM domain-containing protein [Clostridia bacterium]|nr:SPASM domain-containing protein [Clostridia bacterium]